MKDGTKLKAEEVLAGWEPDEDGEPDGDGAPDEAGGGEEADAGEKRTGAKRKTDGASVARLVVGILGIVGGAACAAVGALGTVGEAAEVNFPETGAEEEAAPRELSALTGLELAEGARADGPVYCVQTPNGMDGARPQAGLNEAGVVFEAIAEGGITRFAAIYQEPTAGVIGPIRSLRMYYLQWDTPFDCTVVHAGGAADALAALAAGGYAELDEESGATYRGTNGRRAWNNLFTTGELLAEAAAGRSSQVEGFARLTSEETERARIADGAAEALVITEPAEGDTSAVEVAVPTIAIDFGGDVGYNVIYDYDAELNAYRRSFGTGEPHEVYECPAGGAERQNPEDVCELTQLAPAVVVAMMVRETRAADNYHESITTLGQGKAYIFQNGTAIEGTWSKASAAEQIKFFDEAGDQVRLAAGQTFVEAVPEYGGVGY